MIKKHILIYVQWLEIAEELPALSSSTKDVDT